MQMIQPNFGRRAILTLIVIGAVLSAICLTWVGYGGKISPENMNSAIRDLAEYYSPLLMILAGFYFSEIENKSKKKKTSIESLIFSLAIITPLAVMPPLLIFFCTNIEDVHDLLDTLSPYFTPLSAGCLAFYFSKSGVPESSQEVKLHS